MKALTIRQPWAWAIINGVKDVENRHWKTNLRGTIAIHSSKSMEAWEFTEFVNFSRDKISKNLIDPFLFPIVEELKFGVILGTVDLIDCISKSESGWFTGDYGFILDNPKYLLNPIPFRGSLGFWDIPKEIEMQIKESGVLI